MVKDKLGGYTHIDHVGYHITEMSKSYIWGSFNSTE